MSDYFDDIQQVRKSLDDARANESERLEAILLAELAELNRLVVADGYAPLPEFA